MKKLVRKCTKILVSCICHHVINLFRIRFALKFWTPRTILEKKLFLNYVELRSDSQWNRDRVETDMSQPRGLPSRVVWIPRKRLILKMHPKQFWVNWVRRFANLLWVSVSYLCNHGPSRLSYISLNQRSHKIDTLKLKNRQWSKSVLIRRFFHFFRFLKFFFDTSWNESKWTIQKVSVFLFDFRFNWNESKWTKSQTVGFNSISVFFTFGFPIFTNLDCESKSDSCGY